MHCYTPVAYLHYSLHPRCILQHRHTWPRYARVPASEVSKWDQTPKWTPGRTDPSWEIVVKEWLHVTSKKNGGDFFGKGFGVHIWEIFGGNQDFFVSEMLRGRGTEQTMLRMVLYNCICDLLELRHCTNFANIKNNRRWCPCFFSVYSFHVFHSFQFVCASAPFLRSSCLTFFWQKKKPLQFGHVFHWTKKSAVKSWEFRWFKQLGAVFFSGEICAWWRMAAMTWVLNLES